MARRPRVMVTPKSITQVGKYFPFGKPAKKPYTNISPAPKSSLQEDLDRIEQLQRGPSGSHKGIIAETDRFLNRALYTSLGAGLIFTGLDIYKTHLENNGRASRRKQKEWRTRRSKYGKSGRRVQ